MNSVSVTDGMIARLAEEICELHSDGGYVMNDEPVVCDLIKRHLLPASHESIVIGALPSGAIAGDLVERFAAAHMLPVDHFVKQLAKHGPRDRGLSLSSGRRGSIWLGTIDRCPDSDDPRWSITLPDALAREFLHYGE